MKKILITAVIAMAATTASAFEVGVQVGRDFGDTNRNFGGLTVGQSLGPVTLSAGYHRTSVTANDQNRWSVVGGYDLLKVGPVQLTPTVGAAYLSNKTTSNGLVMTVGVEASMPLYKSLEGVVDYTYQIGQSRVSQFDGNRVSAGLRYKF
jgi:opacity protein-like surface antigen